VLGWLFVHLIKKSIVLKYAFWLAVGLASLTSCGGPTESVAVAEDNPSTSPANLLNGVEVQFDRLSASPAAAPQKVLDSAAASVLYRSVAAHGVDKYRTGHYGFTFREKAYVIRNQGQHLVYARTYEKDGMMVADSLVNGDFSKHIDGQLAKLTAKETAVGREDLNSVIYFATLPDKLRDPAVNLIALPSVTINGQAYDAFGVNFDVEGGGTDHDDNFVYWVNAQTDRIDFLAYDYRTNGGGVRFREAYNPRIVGGTLFQDYVNYKAEVGTALTDLPALFEQGALKKLSLIETEDVEVL
jgi:hypothetical protein